MRVEVIGDRSVSFFFKYWPISNNFQTYSEFPSFFARNLFTPNIYWFHDKFMQRVAVVDYQMYKPSWVLNFYFYSSEIMSMSVPSAKNSSVLSRLVFLWLRRLHLFPVNHLELLCIEPIPVLFIYGTNYVLCQHLILFA